MCWRLKRHKHIHEQICDEEFIFVCSALHRLMPRNKFFSCDTWKALPFFGCCVFFARSVFYESNERSGTHKMYNGIIVYVAKITTIAFSCLRNSFVAVSLHLLLILCFLFVCLKPSCITALHMHSSANGLYLHRADTDTHTKWTRDGDLCRDWFIVVKAPFYQFVYDIHRLNIDTVQIMKWYNVYDLRYITMAPPGRCAKLIERLSNSTQFILDCAISITSAMNFNGYL